MSEEVKEEAVPAKKKRGFALWSPEALRAISQKAGRARLLQIGPEGMGALGRLNLGKKYKRRQKQSDVHETEVSLP